MSRKPVLCKVVADAAQRYLRDMDGRDDCKLYRVMMEEVERPLIATVLDHAEGNHSRAARILGISRTTLRVKLRQHGLVPDSGKR